jgi:hypothetical protein
MSKDSRRSPSQSWAPGLEDFAESKTSLARSRRVQPLV